MPYRQDNDEPTIFIGMLKLIVNWAGALLSIIILITLIIWGFSLNVSDSAEIPVVKAKIKELRVVSEEPGGQIVNYQGLSVNNVQEQGKAQSAATRIILAPEPIKLIEEDVNIPIIENSRVTNEPKVSSLNNGDEENIIAEYDNKIPSDLTVEQILIRSGNIGSVRIGQKLGIEKFKLFLEILSYNRILHLNAAFFNEYERLFKITKRVSVFNF